MAFGKTFLTRKEASAHAKKINDRHSRVKVEVRKLSKKLFPRRKKMFHVGSELDFLNFD